MIRIFIPSDVSISIDKRKLFTLARPFYLNTGWGNDSEVLAKWDLEFDRLEYTSSVVEADVMLLPYSVNDYYVNGYKNTLLHYQQLCKDNGIFGYAVVNGDFGQSYPYHSNLIYFRASGFRSQLQQNHQGFPVFIRDFINTEYNRLLDVREKKAIPTIGFCGHASLSILKRIREKVKFVLENGKRFFRTPWRKDWEPLFASAYERAQILNILSRSSIVKSNFIFRNRYRAGAVTSQTRERTTREYMENIRDSDYVLCMRGGGNFSVRFYETLMMGRIPVFVNTDCLLPFQDTINWKEHVVWVEWGQRKEIDRIIASFHHKLSPDEFRNMQQRNRKLWVETLSVKGIFNLLSTGLLTKKINIHDAEIG